MSKYPISIKHIIAPICEQDHDVIFFTKSVVVNLQMIIPRIHHLRKQRETNI